MNREQIDELLQDIADMREEKATATQILVWVEKSLKKAAKMASYVSQSKID